MVVRKFNYYRFATFLVIVIGIISGIIFGVVKLVNNYKYKQSYDYKLLLVGYKEDEVKTIKDKLNNEEIDNLMELKYDKNIVKFMNEKYFIYKNLSKYLEYKKDNKLESYTNIVTIINTEANIDWFDNTKETDISKKELMLVNRLYGLSKDYEPDDIIDVPSQYAYTGVKISNSIMDNIVALIDAASDEGYTFVLADGYRSYSEQESIFERYKNAYGYSEADRIAARAGHSEYQTGISFTIVPLYKEYDKPKESLEYKWLSDNAYRYGFIFRFPEDKIDITGFEASTWRLRYVGSEAANIIKSENICFEEYYAYFVDR